MPGVKAILTADDVPGPKDQVNDAGQVIKANPKSEKALTNEPLYQGEPVLAVAAVDELTAVEAIERIEIQWEPLPFSVDPVASLLPGAMNPRVEGNVWMRPTPTPGQPPPLPEVQDLKWTEAEVEEYKAGRLPMGKDTDAPWSYGDIEAGFKKASLVLDETFVTPNTSHQCLESRTSMAYWQNGKLFIHLSTQSAVQTVMSVVRWLEHRAGERRAHQRVLRRRLWQQGDGVGHGHHPGAPGQEDGHAGADAHQPRGRARHWRRASRRARPDEGRVHQGRPQSPRSTCSPWSKAGRTARAATATRPAASRR